MIQEAPQTWPADPNATSAPPVARPPMEILEWESATLRRELQRAIGERDKLADEAGVLRARVEELETRINTAALDEFWPAAMNEATHQVDKWGPDHDAGKTIGDWLAVFVYLLGKLVVAGWDDNGDKLKHHLITVAAVAFNAHRRLRGVDVR